MGPGRPDLPAGPGGPAEPGSPGGPMGPGRPRPPGEEKKTRDSQSNVQLTHQEENYSTCGNKPQVWGLKETGQKRTLLIYIMGNVDFFAA